MAQMRKLLAALKIAELQIPIVCGGVIPDDDVTELKTMGVAEVIKPGTLTEDILATVNRAVLQDNY